MKIRIKGNSIRYRLTKTEVKTLGDTGYVEEKTNFGNRVFHYGLKASDTVKELKASFEGDTITLYVPLDDARNWANNDKVGFESHQVLEDGATLLLVLEKDFVCMDETSEDQSDHYPNPKMMC